MARKDFHHPFQPYEIQQDFMEAVYNCIETGKVGIFESPTGTGKSLSLICGSLTWLREHKRKVFDEAVADIELDDDEPEWMVQHTRDAKRQEVRQMRADFEARLDMIRQRERKTRDKAVHGEPLRKRQKRSQDEVPDSDGSEDRFVLDDYESDDDTQVRTTGYTDYSSETMKLMDKLGMSYETGQKQHGEEDHDELKIFFCSRTHSQLSQFVGELRRVKLPPGLPPEPNESEIAEDLKHITLGSRKNLCINSKVNRLASQTAINERCIELQQSKTPLDHKCPFLPKKEDQDRVLDFRDHALAKIHDIEDLATVGRKLQVCPYYGSRPAIGPAEIVTLPYPLLLQKSAREVLGISLKGHIVIIDEAHNLMNAIEGIYSAEITEAQLKQARESLMIYLQKFRNRLKGANRMYVTQVVRVTDSLLQTMAKVKGNNEAGGLITPGELLSGKGVDQVNMLKLVRYINDSKLARKVEGYVAHLNEPVKPNDSTTKSSGTTNVPALTHVQTFLVTLMNPSSEGRFFLSVDAGIAMVRYLLLDPSEHFRDVVEDARAVILAGGTMSPMADYKQQLFPYISSIETMSCGHLIPPDNLLVRTIAMDGVGLLEFNFKARSNPSTAKRIADALYATIPHIKGGLVVFFPSYGFLDQLTKAWSQGGTMERLRKQKALFLDSPTASAEETFKSYSQAVKSTPAGAVLFSVIGGKLSEGINFSDDLGRCVIIVGLPFPNLETPEWKAKMQYIDGKAVARGEQMGKASRELAENVCMRSVNQAIGRVIRHKDDWASILLMDSRYTQEMIKAKLPGWIKRSFPSEGLVNAYNVESVVKSVADFFAVKAP